MLLQSFVGPDKADWGRRVATIIFHGKQPRELDVDPREHEELEREGGQKCRDCVS